MALSLAAIGAGLGQGIEQIYRQKAQQAQLDEIQQRLRQNQLLEQAAPGALALLQGGDDQIQPSAPSTPLDTTPPAARAAPTLPGSQYAPTPAGSGMSSGLTNQATNPYVSRLTSLGVAPDIAAGAISYPFKNESRSASDVNPSSGAFGRMQWLGPRKQKLLSEYGPQPTDEQQADFMAEELQGPERKTLEDLRSAKTPQEAYSVWGKDYERPGAKALAKAGAMPTSIPEAQQHAAVGAQAATQTIDPSLYGRMSISAMAKRLDQVMPGAPPIVKLMALEQASKILAPDQRMQWEYLKSQNEHNFQIGLHQMTIEAENVRAKEMRDAITARQDMPARQGYSIFTSPDSKFQYQEIPGKPETLIGMTGQPLTDEQKAIIAGGVSSKIGTGAQSAPDPHTVDFVAKGIANYTLAPISGWALRSPFGQEVMGKVKQINPEYDQTKYQQKQRGQIAFTSGRQGDTVRSFSVAIDHLAVMQDAAQALANGDLRALNQIKNVVERELGYSGPIDFNFVKSIVGDEVAKAVIGGVGSVADREQLQNGFSQANSPDQLASVAQMAKRLMAGQLGGLRRQAGTAGFSEKDFDNALSPIAKQELQGLQNQATPQGAAPQQGAGGGYQDGDTATNPQTGQKLMYKGGQWVPLPAGGVDVPHAEGPPI